MASEGSVLCTAATAVRATTLQSAQAQVYPAAAEAAAGRRGQNGFTCASLHDGCACKTLIARARRSSLIARCLWPVARRSSPVARRSLPIARCSSPVARARCPSLFTRRSFLVARLPSPVARHLWPVARRSSHFARCSLPVDRRSSLFARRSLVARRSSLVARCSSPVARRYIYNRYARF